MVAPDLLRVRFSPKGEFASEPTPMLNDQQRWASAGTTIYPADNAVYLVSTKMIVVAETKPFRLDVYRREDNSVVLSDASPAITWDDSSGLIATRKQTAEQEAFFGLGFRGGPVNRRGRSLQMLNTDNAGYGEFTDALYANFPFYYGSRGGKAYGVFLNSYSAPFFDMASQDPGSVLFGVEKGELDYYVMAGPEPERIAFLHGQLTGRTPLPPRWSLGYHQSRYSYLTEKQLTDVANRLREEKIPADVLYLDIDYMDDRRNFTWNLKSFPEPERMNQRLEEQGFKRINIVEPCVRDTDPTWKELSAASLLLTDSSGNPAVDNIWFGDVGWLDFSKRTARAWYNTRLRNLLATGVSGVWNDLNEPAQNFMESAVYNFDGSPVSDRFARNSYALLETAETYNSMLAARPNVRPWIISRSGFSGVQRYAATWGGDALSTWDSLRVSIQISNSMGLSGQNFFGHDIGGFLGSPTPELFIRWMQFGSYIPLFRNHAGDTSEPREPWAYGEKYRDLARNVINERYRLLPYIYSVMEEGSRTGLPAVAPPWFHFPADPEAANQTMEFLLGRSLLVAPVYEAGATTRTLHLPGRGFDWIELATGKTFAAGQTITVDAPLEKIPVFARQGAIIPKGEVIQHTGEPSHAMTLEVMPGDFSSFNLYEDDGNSFDYQRGAYLRTELSSTRTPSLTTVSIVRTSGNWVPPDRSWRVLLRGVDSAPASVELNGTPVQSYEYDAATRTVSVSFTDQSGPLNLRVRS